MFETNNRAFMYGESVFTTMRMQDGLIMNWDSHFDRFKRGVEFVYGPFTDGDDWPEIFKNRLETKCQMETGNKVLRLTAYREQARGLMKVGLISINDLKLYLSSTHFDQERVFGKNIKLRTCPGIRRPNWWPSYLKAGSLLETILAQKIFVKSGDDDLLFLSPEDTIWESSVANIFVVRHNRLYTPPAGPNVLEGIMRKKVIDVAQNYFDDFIETGSTIAQVVKSDGVFGTNSVRGLFIVDKIDDYELTHTPEFLKSFEALRDKVCA